MIAALRQSPKWEGLREPRPVGAVLTAGRKNAKGHIDPSTTGRFWITSPLEDENKSRPLLSEFGSVNKAGPTMFRGVLVDSTEGEAWDYWLAAMELGGGWPNHPNRRPACTSGDGESALRLYQTSEKGVKLPEGAEVDSAESDDEIIYARIPCPNRQCEFRVSGKCKVKGRLYFQPRWKTESELTYPLMMWETGSWYSTENVIGFFAHVRKSAENLGLETLDLTGLPFVLNVSKKAKNTRQGRRRFPVVTITPDGNLMDWLLSQRMDLQQIGAHPEPKAIEAAVEPEDAPPEVAIEVPGVEGSLFDE